MACVQCLGSLGDGSCPGAACRAGFLREVVRPTTRLVEIRYNGDMGYGVFVQPNKTINKNTLLDVYLGEVVPPCTERLSAYQFAITLSRSGLIANVDAKAYGNWTRFVNSHCEPNVDATIEALGGQLVVAFIANQDIPAGEQLFINYGRSYFEAQDINCICDGQDKPHLPPN
ncbi:hypothetical protein F5Y15DRAFT_372632 [Xylariaceae sp. FL0016]|nr:hypothetical protein F5Y15DRAFT_372632 [Xylariaceae sp. FL0016]